MKNDVMMFAGFTWIVQDARPEPIFQSYRLLSPSSHFSQFPKSRNNSYPFVLVQVIQFETYLVRYYNKIKQTYLIIMQKQEDTEEKLMTKYFIKYNKLINTNPKLPNIGEVQSKIERMINQGSIHVEPVTQKLSGDDTGRSIKLLSKQIEDKKNQFNKDLVLLNMSLSRSAYLMEKKNSHGSEVKSTRVLNRRTRTDVSQQDYQEYQKRRISSDRRLKQLKKMKNELIRKKSSIELKRQKQREHKQSVSKQIERAKNELQKNAKLSKINQRMKKLEQSRISRLDTLRNSCVRSTNQIPKYKIMRYRFDCNEIEYEREQREKLRNRNIQKQREYSQERIMYHQQQYNKKLKTIKRDQQDADYYHQRETDFNLIRNPQKIDEKFEQNKLKAKLFEDKIASIRNVMPIDPQVGKQFEVAKDKSKHPFKYHYLKKKKNISDIEIFENYSHFNFNAHPVELGNFYLEEINKKNRALVNKSGGSLSKRSKTDGSTSEQKIKYKDYLDQARKKTKPNHKKQDEVQQLLKKYGSKSKVIQILQNKAQFHQNNSLKKIQKLRRFDTYTNTLKLQKQVDDEFINSIKTKLKCFQVA